MLPCLGLAYMPATAWTECAASGRRRPRLWRTSRTSETLPLPPTTLARVTRCVSSAQSRLRARESLRACPRALRAPLSESLQRALAMTDSLLASNQIHYASAATPSCSTPCPPPLTRKRAAPRGSGASARDVTIDDASAFVLSHRFRAQGHADDRCVACALVARPLHVRRLSVRRGATAILRARPARDASAHARPNDSLLTCSAACVRQLRADGRAHEFLATFCACAGRTTCEPSFPSLLRGAHCCAVLLPRVMRRLLTLTRLAGEKGCVDRPVCGPSGAAPRARRR